MDAVLNVPLSIASPPQASSTTVPAGPMPSQGSVFAALAPSGGPFARLSWAHDADPKYISARLTAECSASGVGQSAAVGPVVVVVWLSLPVAEPARVRVSRTLSIDVGQVVPVSRVDVGADGTFELVENGTASQLSVPVTLGPTPLPVLLFVDAAASAGGSVTVGLDVRAEPIGTGVTSLGGGCRPWEIYTVAPTFGGGISASALLPHGFQLTVVGLSAQPAVLGANHFGPCLLIPAPDFVTGPSLSLNVPAAVRPITLWLQSVVLLPTGLESLPAYRVHAL